MAEPIRTVGKYGVELTEYKGELSLVSLYEGSDGKFRKQWVKFHKGKNDYQEKDWPLKISLGDRKTAAVVLQVLLKQVLGEDPAVPPDDADAPF